MAGNQKTRTRCWRWLAAAALAAAAAWPPQAAAVSGAAGQLPTIDPLETHIDPSAITRAVVDVSIRRRVESADGKPRGPVTHAAYRLENTRTGAGWKTVMRRMTPRAALVRVGDGDIEVPVASPIERIEDEGDGTPARVFNDRGVEVRLPSKARLHALAAGEEGALRALGLPEPGNAATPPVATTPARDPLFGLVHRASDRATRQGTLKQRFGVPVGRTRGLDRHLRQAGDEEQETLVDAEAAVPVEVTVTRGGTTVERLRHTYAETSGGARVRRGFRTERLLPGGRGERMIVDVEFSGLRVDTGGAR